MKRKAKSEQKPVIIEYRFGQDALDPASKMKHPTNIIGTRRKLKKNKACALRSTSLEENKAGGHSKKE